MTKHDVSATLNARGTRYGNYSDVAGITQQLISIVQSARNYEHLNACQKTSLFMICNKIARAVSGDVNYRDNYHDIAGYAALAEEACVGVPEAILEAESEQLKAKLLCCQQENQGLVERVNRLEREKWEVLRGGGQEALRGAND